MKNLNIRKPIYFITTNKHKFEEISVILKKEFGVTIKHLDMEYEEDKSADMGAVCEKAAKKLANILKKNIFVEDTGLYFEAYNNFPGPMPKFIINGIGFDGVFRLLAGKSRKAYFKTAIGYCEPGKIPVIFEGIMKGVISKKVILPKVPCMPYDHIFIPQGYKQAIVEMPIDLKNSFLQRGQATRKFGNYLVKKK